ncbi:MAG: SDR family NAD(P)-dependent oxidoreductase [Candidatus Aminicenantes bacterium]|nr:SDR family NAD(P)-dependent oxidoreductase [Candidatus Aminicenantes bacterium]
MEEKWNAVNVKDQTGRTAVVTGSSSGIGYEAGRVLAEKNAAVIIAVRNLEKGCAVADKIRTSFQNADVRVMELDLADFQSIRRFSDNFLKEYSHLDLLINNAGVMMPPYSKTVDGFELQFGTNHLGHFALTGLLLDVINKTPGARIVNVSSSAHLYGRLDFDDLNWQKRTYKKSRAYGDSKIANLYFTYELQKKLKEAGQKTLVTAAHPGWTATELQRHAWFFDFMNRFVGQHISMGALPTLYAAVVEDVEGGDYFGPSGWREVRGYPKKVQSNRLSHDEQIAVQLWEVSEKLTGICYRFK